MIHRRRFTPSIACALAALLLLTGCLEQYQSPRSPSGALWNFLIHLENGELDDARAYFAPGIVTPTASLDAQIKQASERVRKYEFRKRKADANDLPDGRRVETIRGELRPLLPKGAPTYGPEDGWVNETIITATMVMRGPGWRLTDFRLVCCEAGE